MVIITPWKGTVVSRAPANAWSGPPSKKERKDRVNQIAKKKKKREKKSDLGPKNPKSHTFLGTHAQQHLPNSHNYCLPFLLNIERKEKNELKCNRMKRKEMK